MAAWIRYHTTRIWMGGIYFEKQVKLHFACVFFVCFSRSSANLLLVPTAIILTTSWYANPFQINSPDNNDDNFVSPRCRRRRSGCGKGGKVYGLFHAFHRPVFLFPELTRPKPEVTLKSDLFFSHIQAQKNIADPVRSAMEYFSGSSLKILPMPIYLPCLSGWQHIIRRHRSAHRQWLPKLFRWRYRRWYLPGKEQQSTRTQQASFSSAWTPFTSFFPFPWWLYHEIYLLCKVNSGFCAEFTLQNCLRN